MSLRRKEREGRERERKREREREYFNEKGGEKLNKIYIYIFLVLCYSAYL